MCSLRKGKYNQQFTCYNKSCSTAPCHLLPVGGYGVINERLRLNGGTSEGGSAEGEERREGRRIDLESAEEERRKELKVFPPFYTHYIL